MAGSARADLKNLAEHTANDMYEDRKHAKNLKLFFHSVDAVSAMAQHHGEQNADLHAAIEAFDHAYANNDVEKYFNFNADDATAYFGDGRVDIAAYHKMWTELMAASGGVEMNEMSRIVNLNRISLRLQKYLICHLSIRD